MPDEKDRTKGDETETPLHAHKEGREQDVQGSIPSGEHGTEDVSKTGDGPTGGDAGSDTAEPEEGDGSEEGGGEKGLGSQTDAVGGAKTPANPDPSTKGATKGTEGAR